MNRSAVTVVSVALSIFLSGCAARSAAPAEAPPSNPYGLDGAPTWVLGDCHKYLQDPDSICAVGIMSGAHNVAMARTAAIQRARTALARDLHTEIKALYMDYMQLAGYGDAGGSAGGTEQLVRDTAEQFSQATISGSTLSESWISRTGDFYALVSVNVDAFKEAVRSMNGLDRAMREYIQNNAERAFSDLRKRSGRG